MHALLYRAYQLQKANGEFIKRNARTIHRAKAAKPPHVLSDERASITKVINIKPSDISANRPNVASTQQKTSQQYITRVSQQCKSPRWLGT